MSVRIVRATDDDPIALAEVCALLEAAGLPVEGVAQHFSHFLLALNDRKLCGCAGAEIHGDVALLRSLAVAPAQQKTGLGRQLTESILKLAGESGADEIVLLTTTARDFFVNKFGFVGAKREDYQERLRHSPEWNLPRCASAIFLRRNL
jgi:N-acetylglutamate synthase-like GNAT family acetyltransferase